MRFLLPRISMSNSVSHKFLTVSVVLPLSDLIVRLENVTPISGNVSLIRAFSWRSLFKISQDAERVPSFFPMWIMMYFGFLQRIGCTSLRSFTIAPGNFLILTLCYLFRISSISPFKVKSPVITQVPGVKILLGSFYLLDFQLFLKV